MAVYGAVNFHHLATGPKKRGTIIIESDAIKKSFSRTHYIRTSLAFKNVVFV